MTTRQSASGSDSSASTSIVDCIAQKWRPPWPAVQRRSSSASLARIKAPTPRGCDAKRRDGGEA
jgi:hypothetical protein